MGDEAKTRVVKTYALFGFWFVHRIAGHVLAIRTATEGLRIPAKTDSDSDRLRTAIPIDRGQRSGERGQQFPSTA
jgi:hypothetical protein